MSIDRHDSEYDLIRKILGKTPFASEPVPSVPAAPEGLTAMAVSDTQINVVWTAGDATHDTFTLQRKTGAGEFATIESGLTDTSYSDTGLGDGTEYTYRVAAVNAVGISDWSNEDSATTDVATPAAPTGFSLTATGATTADTAWTDNSDNETGFEVWTKEGAGSFELYDTVGANEESLALADLLSETEYTGRVRAFRTVGAVTKFSDWSNEDSATTEPPPPPPEPFTTTWKTDNAGTSNNDQISLPLVNGGSYDFTVDWGDGTDDHITAWNDAAKTHTYPSAGTYTVKITGTFSRIFFNNGGDRQKILSIENWGDLVWSSMNGAFRGCSNMVINASDLPNTGTVTNFRLAWQNCSGLTSFPLLDVSSGTDFGQAWENCSGLTSFPELNVSSGTNFSTAWQNCSGLTSFPLLDVSSGTDFTGAWFGCFGLTSFPLLDVSSGTNFSTAWRNCSGLTSFPLLDVSSGTNFSTAWQNCSGLTSFPELNVSSGTNFSQAWQNCSGLTSFSLLDVSSGTNFSGAWVGCTGLTSFPLLDVSSGTTFSFAWFGCTGLTSLAALNVSSGTDFGSAFATTGNIEAAPLQGTNANISFATNKLERQAIVDIFTGLNDRSAMAGRTVTISSNPGIGDLTAEDYEIATDKNWTVTD
jgi:hypothetical protein